MCSSDLDSSLHLFLANDINDHGEIVGFGVEADTGATVAFLAVPVLNGGGAAGGFSDQTESNSRNFTVPESVRQRLLRRLGVVIPGR